MPPKRKKKSSPPDDEQHRVLPEATRQRNRAVAEREASRLARPERRKVDKLKHASKLKSAVSSTPFGVFHHHQQRGDGDDEEEEAEEWCGPFSVARQMIAKREAAKQEREEALNEENQVNHPLDDIMKEVDMERKRKAHPSLRWKGKVSSEQKSGNIYSKRQKRMQAQWQSTAIPTLFQTCVNFLVDNFEHVEALGQVDSSIRRAVCYELIAKQKMTGEAFEVLAEEGIEALELVDCAQVTQDQMVTALTKLLPAGLRFLILGHSGRCFGPKAVETICDIGAQQLFAISIGGAYLLEDEHAGKLMETCCKNLSSVEFKACPKLGANFCKALSTNFGVQGQGTLLELSLEDLNISKENLISLKDTMHNLKSLTLRQCQYVDDDVVSKLLQESEQLEGVDFSNCVSLTDTSLSSIRSCNKKGCLRSLTLSGLKNLTNVGLEALFTPVIEGLPSPPKLRHVDLSGCNNESVNDSVLDMICKASSMKRDTATGDISDQLSSMGGLVSVNISGSSCSDETMESLAATTAVSLKEVNINFTPHVTDKGLGYLVEKARVLEKIKIWGCAQISDEFLDGHARVGDSNLQVIGAWMKKGKFSDFTN